MSENGPEDFGDRVHDSDIIRRWWQDRNTNLNPWRPPPGHHRPAAPAHDPHQPPALIIINLTNPDTLTHQPSLPATITPGTLRDRANVTCYGTSSFPWPGEVPGPLASLVQTPAGRRSGRPSASFWARAVSAPYGGGPPGGGRCEDGQVVTAELLARAREGDGEAFRQLVEPHRRELQVHCYRVLGSLADAEDLLQETLLATWQGLAGFQGQASLRSWLYRIATNRCLNWLCSARRRPAADWPVPDVAPPEPSRLGEVTWLDPYPDVLLDQAVEPEPGPEARYEMQEAISLAFVTALQLLPPRQRAVLILRDLPGFRAAEVADVLETTEESVTSALKRARATLSRDLTETDRPLPPKSADEQRLLASFLHAWERADVEGIVSLMREDAWLRMPQYRLSTTAPGLSAGSLPLSCSARAAATASSRPGPMASRRSVFTS